MSNLETAKLGVPVVRNRFDHRELHPDDGHFPMDAGWEPGRWFPVSVVARLVDVSDPNVWERVYEAMVSSGEWTTLALADAAMNVIRSPEPRDSES